MINCRISIIFIVFLLISESFSFEYFTDYKITNCSMYKQELANISAQTTLCFLEFSQPLRICSNCRNEKKAVDNKFKALMNNKIRDGNVNCEPILLQSDVSTTIESFKLVFDKEWTDGNCEHCYKKDSPEFSVDYTRFIELENSAMSCLQVFTNASLNFSNPKFETIWSGFGFDVSACRACNANYSAVNSFYTYMQEKVTGSDRQLLWNGVCGDIGDIMNTTRYLWSKEFKCDNSQVNLIFSLPLFIVIVVTLLFYCLASTYFHDKMRVVFYKQRRLKYMSNDNDRLVTET